jgi:hypothetical protein
MELVEIQLYENKYRFFFDDTIKQEMVVIEIPKDKLFLKLSEAYSLLMKNLTAD